MEAEHGQHLLRFVKSQYNFFFHDNTDERVKELPLLGDMYPIVVACSGYFVLVCYLLPWFMKGREPFKLRKTMMVYNAFQVVQNLWILALSIKGGWFNGYSFVCQPTDFSRRPQAMMMVYAIWFFFFSKIVDWLDTVFFVLRKSYGQVSFLHVYHHLTTPFFTWYVARFIGGGQGTLILPFNSTIHVLMYMYYLLAALGYHKYLWWKRYLTLLQMVQFVLLMIHQFQLFFVECDYPRFTRILTIPTGIVMFSLFYKFYLDAYNKKKHEKAMTKLSDVCGKFACLKTDSFKNGKPTSENESKVSTTSIILKYRIFKSS